MARWRFEIPRPGHPFGSAARVPRRKGIWDRSLDLCLAAALTILAPLLATLLPEASPVRWTIVLTFLLLVPGYLFIQALVVQAPPRRFEILHPVFAIGISPAVIGLLALSTTMVPNGYRPSTVFVIIIGACVILTVVAFIRRAARLREPADAATGPSS